MPLDAVRRGARTVLLYGLGLGLLSVPVGIVVATATGLAAQYRAYLLLLGVVTLLAGAVWTVSGLIAFGARLGTEDDGTEPSMLEYY